MKHNHNDPNDLSQLTALITDKKGRAKSIEDIPILQKPQIQANEPSNPLDKLQKVNFLTCDLYPQLEITYQIWFGSSVSARSVKLIKDNLADRDTWWNEIREEIKKNALSVYCNYILGYRETISVYDDVMILSATGTAIKIRPRPPS